MSPFDNTVNGIRLSAEGRRRHRSDDPRPQRLDHYALAAEEYRRALHSVLLARGETQFRHLH